MRTISKHNLCDNMDRILNTTESNVWHHETSVQSYKMTSYPISIVPRWIIEIFEWLIIEVNQADRIVYGRRFIAALRVVTVTDTMKERYLEALLNYVNEFCNAIKTDMYYALIAIEAIADTTEAIRKADIPRMQLLIAELIKTTGYLSICWTTQHDRDDVDIETEPYASSFLVAKASIVAAVLAMEAVLEDNSGAYASAMKRERRRPTGVAAVLSKVSEVALETAWDSTNCEIGLKAYQETALHSLDRLIRIMTE